MPSDERELVEYHCRNCGAWYPEHHTYCPGCHYSTVEPDRRDCPRCNTGMHPVDGLGIDYICPDCDKEWFVEGHPYTD